MALASEKVVALAIEANEFPEMTRSYGVQGVPRTVVNRQGAFVGALPEQQFVAAVLAVLALLFGLVARPLLIGWSYLAALLIVAILFAGVYYLVYSVLQAAADPLGPIVWFGSVVLLLLELAALGLSLSYAFEVLDVLSRRRKPGPPFDPTHTPFVALQVPTYNEPVEVVSRTLESLARLDYA